MRWGDGRYGDMPKLAAEVVATRPDVFVAVGGNPVGLAAKAATSTIPVVFGAGADPVKIGLVDNLNRPGGNLTGMTLWANELDAKRLDLLHDMLPEARKVAVLMNPDNPGYEELLPRTRETATALGLEIELLTAAGTSAIERAFQSLPAGSVDALAVGADAFLINSRARILALDQRTQAAGDLPGPRVRRRRRAGELRHELGRHVSHPRHLCRPPSQGRQADRPAGAASDDLRTGGQPQDGTDAGPRPAAPDPDPRRRGDRVKRRLLLATASALPSIAWAQGSAMRRVAVLISLSESDPEGQMRFAGLREGLHDLGWIEGKNLAIDVRFAGGSLERTHELAQAFAAATPDVIVVNGTPALGEIHKATRTIPVVFMAAVDPVGLGYIDSLARPGGNITGFGSFDVVLVGKWLQLLKEMMPALSHATVAHNPSNTP